ncbi:Deubiquitinase MYSM1 [Trichinella spiralis]|uniref:Deubiquitinase MYSM1 n=1 Tax=Trichinella spiralis TaxID=6334 RepID=A0ABR3KW77_TRISP
MDCRCRGHEVESDHRRSVNSCDEMSVLSVNWKCDMLPCTRVSTSTTLAMGIAVVGCMRVGGPIDHRSTYTGRHQS